MDVDLSCSYLRWSPVYHSGADPGFLKKGGGGPGADTGFFTSTPPLDIVRVTSSDLRKFEKHPHSWTFTKGGVQLWGPMLKSLHCGPKGGVRTPWTPPPLDPPLPFERGRRRLRGSRVPGGPTSEKQHED